MSLAYRSGGAAASVQRPVAQRTPHGGLSAPVDSVQTALIH